jgi:hypothetical protein
MANLAGPGAGECLPLQARLAPFPSEEMICWPVNARLSNVRNNDPGLIEPIAAQ